MPTGIYPRTDKHKYWLGKKRSPEDIKKMPDGHKGQVPWCKGKPLVNYAQDVIKENI